MRLFSWLACTALLPAVVLAQDNAGQGLALGERLKRAANVIIQGQRPLDPEEQAADDAAAGVERLTDANYQAKFASAGPNDVWVINVHGYPTDAVSTAYTAAHNNATKAIKEAIAKGTIKSEGKERYNYRFARVDWVTEFALCTRWVITKPPYLVIASHDGKEARFLAAPKFPADGEWQTTLLKENHWKNIAAWHSPLSPGGDLSYLVEYYISFNQWYGKYTKDIPRWGWLLVSMGMAGVGQRLLSWMHSGDDEAQRKFRERQAADAAAQAKKAE